MSEGSAKTFEAAAEHLRQSSFVMVSAVVVCLLVVFQGQPGLDIGRANEDLAKLQLLYLRYGDLKSRVEVKQAFAQDQAESTLGRVSGDYTVSVGRCGIVKVSMDQYLVYEAFTDGGMGVSRHITLSGGGRSTWGSPKSEISLPDPTVAELANLWDRLDQSFEVIVPIGGPPEKAWFSDAMPMPVEVVTEGRPIPFDADRQPRLDLRDKEILLPKATGPSTAPLWGFRIETSHSRQTCFLPSKVKTTTVTPQVLAMKAIVAPARWIPGSFRTAFPDLFRRLGAEADKPATRLASTLEKELQDSRESAYFELAGFKIRQSLLNSVGLGIVIALQLYLWLHLRGFRNLGDQVLKGRIFPWLAFYPDCLSRLVAGLLIGLVPLVPIGYIGVRTLGEGPRFLIIGAVASLPLAGLSICELLRLWKKMA